LLYRSKDLRQWEFLHPLATGRWTECENPNPVDSGEMWECPDFFPLGSKHVLLYSTAGKVVWETGELDSKEIIFHSQRNGVLDYGAYYAQKTQLDAKGNRILWGWIPERRPEAEFSAAGWAGLMALPRLLSLSAENDLEMRAAPATEALRGKVLAQIGAQTTSEEQTKILSALQIENLAGELVWKCGAGPFSLMVSDGTGPWWSLQAETSGSSATLRINERQIEIPVRASSESEFHLILDASVAELFCNHLHVLTTRIYRKPEGLLRLQMSDTDAAALRFLQAWQLRPISRDRLTT